jgi:centromeric protein E
MFVSVCVSCLLQPSLTGTGAKVSIICNVTPASSQSDETWNTLRFADGAKRIKVGGKGVGYHDDIMGGVP